MADKQRPDFSSPAFFVTFGIAMNIVRKIRIRMKYADVILLLLLRIAIPIAYHPIWNKR